MNDTIYETAFDSTTVDTLEAELWRLVSERRLPVDAGSLSEVVVELADNALLHSGEDGGWFSVQIGGRAREELAVVVSDRGVGIPHRVNQAAADRDLDDYQALLLAFQPRFSSTGDPHRGFGLNIALEYTGRIPGSALTVESGRAVFAATDAKGRVLSRGARPVQGVTARLSVPVSSSGPVK
ncbi:MAG: ATP-binding protein [bacterium]|nr:ATP-binding protein [bacterium]MDE0600623.1 ATP-binding protein [bacterium]